MTCPTCRRAIVRGHSIVAYDGATHHEECLPEVTAMRSPDAVDRAPSPDLVALLVAGCDGGGGEYDRHLPPALVAEVHRCDATYYAALVDGGAVEWWRMA